MSDNGSSIGLWGPPKNSDDSPKKSQPEVPSVKDVSNAAREETERRFSTRKKKRWGLLDVLWAFLIFIGTQIILSLGLIFWVAFNSVSSGGSVEDVNSILDSVIDTAYSGPFLLMSSLLMYASWMIVMRNASFKKGLKSFAKDFWLRFNWKRDIPLGLLLAAGLRGLEQVISLVLTQLGVDLSTGGNTDIIINQPGIWYVINAIIIAGLAAPFFEELFFRGLFLQAALRNFRRGQHVEPRTFFGQMVKDNSTAVFNGYVKVRHLMYRWRYGLAIFFSSFVFGCMHFQGVETFAQIFVIIQTGLIGAVLAFVVIRTKRLGLAIWAHVFFNLSGVILATLLAS